MLEKLLKDELKLRSKRNLVQSQVFSEKLKKTLNSHHNRAISTMQVIEDEGARDEEDSVVTLVADEPPDGESFIGGQVVDEDDDDDEPGVELVTEPMTDPEPEPTRRQKRISEGWDD